MTVYIMQCGMYVHILQCDVNTMHYSVYIGGVHLAVCGIHLALCLLLLLQYALNILVYIVSKLKCAF